MAILTFPPALAGRVTALDWHLQANTQTFTSPLSRATQSAELPGAMWIATLQMAPMREDRWRAWSAWVAQLRGAAGRFRLTPPHAALPAGGEVAGSLTVSQIVSSTVLRVAGLPPSTTSLRTGDLVHVVTGTDRQELKILVADVETNGSGLALMTFEPPLRRQPAVGAAVVCNGPSAIMRFVDDDQGALSLAAGPKAVTRLSIVEAIP